MFSAKHCSIAQLFGGSYQLYAALCYTFQTLQRKLFNRKRKPPTMSKSDMKSNYQNIIVRISPALYRHVFVSFQNRASKPLIYYFCRNGHDQYTSPLARPSLNALQVVTTSFGFLLRECMESSSPHPRDYYLL